jgi:hypothetical protein
MQIASHPGNFTAAKFTAANPVFSVCQRAKLLARCRVPWLYSMVRQAAPSMQDPPVIERTGTQQENPAESSPAESRWYPPQVFI